MYFFFHIFDRWSIVKLTGSICVFFNLFLRSFRWIFDRKVDGPVWVVLGRSWDLCVRSWVALGTYLSWHSGAGLGTYFGSLGPFLGLYRRSWAALGASLGGSWVLCWRSYPALEPLLAILARSWGGCVRSWAALGA